MRTARRVSSAALDATLIVFGLWWVNVVTDSVIPKSVRLVLLTVVWLAEFVSKSLPDGPS